MFHPTTTAHDHHANLVAHRGPSPVGAWFRAALERFGAGRSDTPKPRDREREAAEVRTLAETVRRTDPRFAADLFAAADRHETTGP